jgi:superfamily I DNA and/or RNA helicase
MVQGSGVKVNGSTSLITSHLSLLLTAYTHRAVDEICGMLEDCGQDYLLLGNEASCDPRYAHRLLSNAFAEHPKLSDIRQRLKEVRIVVSTLLTLQARPFLLGLKHFSLCIVDEASQILEPPIIGLLSSEHIDRFILIGDHKQLPAVVQQPDDEPRLHTCRQSLFERLLRQEQEAGRTEFTGLLNHQGRMHPDIAQFPNEMFYRLEQLQPVPCPHQLEQALDYNEPSEDDLDHQLKHHRVLFLPSSDEATLVADLLRRIYRQIGAEHFDADRSIGVIVTYRYQIAQIRRAMAQMGLAQLSDISIDTVERYQGSQRDVIIYSLGVQNEADLDFLTSNCFEEDGHTIDRKLNVAMTRARKQLLMTGRTDVLRQNDIFQELMQRYST